MFDDLSDEDLEAELEARKGSQRRNPLRDVLNQTEKERDELRKQVAEAETAKRENAFLKAGISPDDPKMKYFAKGYEGDLDPDVIRAEAVSAGLMEPAAPNPELVEAAKAAAVSNGGQTPTPQSADADYQSAMGQTRSQADVLGVMRTHGKEIDNIV